MRGQKRSKEADNPSQNDKTSYYLYILRCQDDSLYTGIALDPIKRLAVHNAGKGSRYVASRRPVVIAYLEKLDSKSAALKQEVQVKKLKRSQKLALIENYRRKSKNSDNKSHHIL